MLLVSVILGVVLGIFQVSAGSDPGINLMIYPANPKI
jgi:hypothetical protein